MISDSIKHKIETAAGKKIAGVRSVTGGCISQAVEVITSDNSKYFLKVSPGADKEMFLKEANGLRELKKSTAIRVPEVFLADREFILMEYITPAPRIKGFFRDFGNRFALMHKTTSEHFGFYEDNFIGSTVQFNIAEGKEQNSWADFYLNKRILFQYRLAERNGYSAEPLRTAIKSIENRIYDILAGSDEIPSLLHGDLWNGNFITDDNGYVCLIDPAVYYGHREADLAMTKLFGGFPEEFYSCYNENYPLFPGHNERENIYKLYHALNHLNLFGNSYYYLSLTLAKSYM